MNQAEGDGNLSPARQDWAARHLDDATRAMLAEDERWFLRQSLSTPCLNIVERSQGYSHPKLVAAIKAQLDALPFCPCRYTNRAAIELARHLVELPLPRSAARSAAWASISARRSGGGARRCRTPPRSRYCLEDGLGFKLGGGNVVTLCPPLTVTRSEFDHALDILDGAIARLHRSDAAPV